MYVLGIYIAVHFVERNLHEYIVRNISRKGFGRLNRI